MTNIIGAGLSAYFSRDISLPVLDQMENTIFKRSVLLSTYTENIFQLLQNRKKQCYMYIWMEQKKSNSTHGWGSGGGQNPPPGLWISRRLCIRLVLPYQRKPTQNPPPLQGP